MEYNMDGHFFLLGACLTAKRQTQMHKFHLAGLSRNGLVKIITNFEALMQTHNCIRTATPLILRGFTKSPIPTASLHLSSTWKEKKKKFISQPLLCLNGKVSGKPKINSTNQLTGDLSSKWINTISWRVKHVITEHVAYTLATLKTRACLKRRSSVLSFVLTLTKR